MPTSLTYILLSTRGCSPWRPDAVMGTTGHEIQTTRPLSFHGPSGAHQTRPNIPCFPALHRLSPDNPIPGRSEALNRKENSAQGSRGRPQVPLRRRVLSASRCGNINPLPFRWTGAKNAPLHTDFPHLLGSTHPCPINVHTEPFSTSVFKVLT